VADSFWSEQVNPAAKEVLQEEGQVHEVSECGVLELHKYVDVAFFCLFSSDKGAEESDTPDGKALFDLLLVASKDIDDFQGYTSLCSFI